MKLIRWAAFLFVGGLIVSAFHGSPVRTAHGAEIPPLPTDVPMAGDDFPGAPPAFVVPVGGHAELVTTPNYLEFVLLRADGTTFARAQVRNGRTIAGYFYDERGDLSVVTTAYYPEDAESTAKRSLQSQKKRRRLRGGSPRRAVRTL